MTDTLTSPAFSPEAVAVITGAASGIGRAVALRLAGMGMRIALADLPGEALEATGQEVAALAPALVMPTDVSRRADVEALQQRVTAEWGPPSVLMNNAATGGNPGKPWENGTAWEDLLATNLMGVIHGVQAFVPAMLESGTPGIVINTGSKQGITSPPGNSAYNLSKAGVRSYTESLSHALREESGDRISAHLLIPGFTFTGMTGRPEKPAAAWTADQVAGFMLEGIAAGDFYILCPDNDVDRATDEKRMRWAMDDIIENRPALSRWHRDYKDAFARFIAE